MDAAQVTQQMQERLVPHFEELGLEAFVIIGYLREGDGAVKRVTFGALNKNPAFNDGLAPILAAAAKWGAGQL